MLKWWKENGILQMFKWHYFHISICTWWDIQKGHNVSLSYLMPQPLFLSPVGNFLRTLPRGGLYTHSRLSAAGQPLPQPPFFEGKPRIQRGCRSVAESCPTLVTPWTVTCQASLSMGFPRQEYWSGLPFPSLGDLPDPGIKLWSPTLQVDSVPSEPPGKPLHIL